MNKGITSAEYMSAECKKRALAFRVVCYVKLDIPFSKRFSVTDRVRVEVLTEFFNVLNRANPAAVQQFQNPSIPLGKPLQNLPGREGQFGLRVDF
jgi:hypothetical protein